MANGGSGHGDSDVVLEELEAFRLATTGAQRISRLLNSAVIAQRATEMVHGFLRTDLVAIAVREGSNRLAMRGVSGHRTSAFGRLQVPRGAGIGGKVLIVREPIAVTDYESDPNITHDFVDVVVNEEGLGPMIGVPLVAEDDIVGVLYTGSRSSAFLDNRMSSFLTQMADNVGPQLGLALQAERTAQMQVHEERQRIASELHDTVGQLLFGIGASARQLRGRLPPEAANLLDDLRSIEAQVSQAASYVRDAIRTITPSTAEALPVSLRLAAEEFSERSSVMSHVVVVGEPQSLSPTLEGLLLRVVREALHNVEKHAQATSVILTLHYGGHEAQVIVQDDGRGLPLDFEFPKMSHGDRRWGLASLSKRLWSIGGELLLNPNEDGGSTLRARIPVSVPDKSPILTDT